MTRIASQRSLPQSVCPDPRGILRAALGFVIGACLLWLGALPAMADIRFPALSGRVVDQANLLTPAVEQDLTEKLAGLEAATTDQVVVVTLSSLEGQEIEDYGYQLGRHWGIGHKTQTDGSNDLTKKDNGILLIVAPNERKVRIEVGYGLEPVMTDAMSSLIIQRAILPKFRDGDMQAGIVAGTDAIIEQLSLDRGVAVQRAQQAQASQGESEELPIPVIIIIIIFIFLFAKGWLPWFLLGNVLGGGGGWRSGGGGWSGGGGGGFSGGGGGFGGGGSSGGW